MIEKMIDEMAEKITKALPEIDKQFIDAGYAGSMTKQINSVIAKRMTQIS